jgi:hypothetical protein
MRSSKKIGCFVQNPALGFGFSFRKENFLPKEQVIKQRKHLRTTAYHP